MFACILILRIFFDNYIHFLIFLANSGPTLKFFNCLPHLNLFLKILIILQYLLRLLIFRTVPLSFQKTDILLYWQDRNKWNRRCGFWISLICELRPSISYGWIVLQEFIFCRSRTWKYHWAIMLQIFYFNWIIFDLPKYIRRYQVNNWIYKITVCHKVFRWCKCWWDYWLWIVLNFNNWHLQFKRIWYLFLKILPLLLEFHFFKNFNLLLSWKFNIFVNLISLSLLKSLKIKFILKFKNYV